MVVLVFLQISQISSSVMGLFGGTSCDLVWWGWVWNFSILLVCMVSCVAGGHEWGVHSLGRVGPGQCAEWWAATAWWAGLAVFPGRWQAALGAGSGHCSPPLAWVAWMHIVQLGPAALVAGLARLLHIVQLGPSALEAGLAHHRVQLGQMGGLWVYMLIFGLKLGVKLDWVCTWQQATL